MLDAAFNNISVIWWW